MTRSRTALASPRRMPPRLQLLKQHCMMARSQPTLSAQRLRSVFEVLSVLVLSVQPLISQAFVISITESSALHLSMGLQEAAHAVVETNHLFVGTCASVN